MQAILYIPSVAALGRQPRQPSHIVGDEALMVMHDPSAEWLAYATVIGRVVNDSGQPAPLIAPEHQATYDRLWPRTPVTWTDEEGTHESTPPALFGCLGLPPPEPSEVRLAAAARERRGALLAESDWIVARSVERGEAVPAEWAAYRQALRDIPQQEGFPYNIDWPTPQGAE